MTMSEVVAAALAASPPAPRDAAVAALAEAYAKALDDAPAGDTKVLATFGPKLFAALESLQLTPRSRGARTPENDDDQPEQPAPVTRLDELRDRARQRRAAAVDTATP